MKQPRSKRQKTGFQDQLSLNAGQKYCRMLQGEHSEILPKGELSAILSTFIKLPFVIKIFVLSIFERPFYTGFTVCKILSGSCLNTFEVLGNEKSIKNKVHYFYKCKLT